ncbi:ParA family protein [uncultured Acetatifactor sp.]|uniref:ParA family protein n=1 Tax=uncultured Acetatifactor sp. TaxID=1671927 RepID=UPI00261D80CC|nr:ParA family protein [uncultured Acetatifactor sp.]
MNIVAIMNQKGGIGKTMTAASIAYILGEEHGKKVLVADADQQGNISMLYDRYEPEGIGMSELLERNIKTMGGRYRTSDVVQATPHGNIDIIPANGYLMRTNMQLLLQEKEDQVMRFRAAMEEVEDAYDCCIVDCGLLMDMAVTNVLVAADIVVVPVKIGGFEISAINNMAEQLEDLRSINSGIRMKLLMTMRQKNQTSLQVERWLKEASGYGCFRTAVRRSIVAEKATMEGVPLPRFSKNGIVTQDYRKVVAELLEDMEG